MYTPRGGSLLIAFCFLVPLVAFGKSEKRKVSVAEKRLEVCYKHADGASERASCDRKFLKDALEYNTGYAMELCYRYAENLADRTICSRMGR